MLRHHGIACVVGCLQLSTGGAGRGGLPTMVARKYCPVVVWVVVFREMLYAGLRLTAKDFRPPSSCKA